MADLARTDNAEAKQAWRPSKVRTICARFEAPCYWCSDPVPVGSSAAFYPDERAIAHEHCHTETCG